MASDVDSGPFLVLVQERRPLRCFMYLSRHLQQAHREVDWLGRCALSLARFSFGLRVRVRERGGIPARQRYLDVAL